MRKLIEVDLLRLSIEMVGKIQRVECHQHTGGD